MKLSWILVTERDMKNLHICGNETAHISMIHQSGEVSVGVGEDVNGTIQPKMMINCVV